MTDSLCYSHGLSDRVEHSQVVSRSSWVSTIQHFPRGVQSKQCGADGSLDKMLVDNVGDVTITNDGATILSLLEVTHPAVSVAFAFDSSNLPAFHDTY